MDRPARFSSRESKYYAASVQRSDTPGDTSDSSIQSAQGFQTIDLRDLNEWLQKSQSERRPLPPLQPRWQEMRETGDTFPTKRSPSFTVEEPKDPAPEYNEYFTKKPAPQFDQNFLHPPTPNRDSFAGIGMAAMRNQEDEHDTARLHPRRLSVNMERSSRFGWWTLCLLIITIIMVTLSAFYSNGSTKSFWQDRFFTTSASNAILILRIMTEACALLLAALVMVVVEDLQWALASRPQGVDLLHFIGMDSGTGVWGLLRLLATADWKQKYSSLFRLLVICMIPLPGIVLMGDISLEFVFFPQDTYNIAAGVAAFNASYIDQVDESVATALLVQMGSPSWSVRDSWSMEPFGPKHGSCTTAQGAWIQCDESHMLVGGVLALSPQKDNLSIFPDSTAYVVPKTRSVQLEYGTVHDLEGLYNNGTCYLLGSSFAASYWCTGTGSDQELLFGSSYCPLAIQSKNTCLNDTSWTSPLRIASSLFVYKRYATVSYNRGNSSILSVSDLTEPEREIIKLEDYMLALSAVVPGFHPTNQSSNSSMGGDNSALAIYAVTALPLNDNEIAKSQSLQAVRKAMSVPFNYFQGNFFSNASIFELKEPRRGLSEDMYTTMSICITSHQVVAGSVSRWLFGLLSAIILAICTVIIVLTMRICGSRPQRCGYPTLDFAAICAAKGGILRPTSSSSADEENGTRGGDLHRSLTSLGNKPTPFQVARRIKGERVMLGS